MQYALEMYCTILRGRKGGQILDHLFFIDLNAGSGMNELGSKSYEGKVRVAGTALIGAVQPAFDHHYFVEPLRKKATALELRLAKLLPPGSFTVYREAAGTAVVKILEDMKKRSKKPHFMAFVDPEGFTEITLEELKPLLDSGRGDFLFNFQYQMAARAPDAARRFLGVADWDPSIGAEATSQLFRERLGQLGRPKAELVRVESGATSNYAYDIVWCAARTGGGNPWLAGFRKEVDRRMKGCDGAFLDDILFSKTKSLNEWM